MRQYIAGLLISLASAGSALASQSLLDYKPIEQQLGSFDFQVTSKPSRSMAEGLVKPEANGQINGGIDVSHPSGLYFGQWVSNTLTSDQRNVQTDSYTGFTRPLTSHIGYEFGTLLRSTATDKASSSEHYAGLSLYGNRLGAAYSYLPDRQDQSLLADLSTLDALGLRVTLKYNNYHFNDPQYLPGGNLRGYQDWSLGLARSLAGFNLRAAYTGSSLSPAQCSLYSGSNSYCGTALEFKASRPL